jgi:hypothetical protein
VGPAGLHDLGELLGLGLERRLEVAQGGDEVPDHPGGRGDVDGGREHVVGGLRGVDVVVGVHVAPEQTRGERREHLVHVHVRGGAGAGLEDVHGEVLVVLPGRHLVGGGHDGLGQVLREHAEAGVGLGGGLLDPGEGLDVAALERGAGDREVLHRALRLRPVQGVLGDEDVTHGVVLDAEAGRG